MTNKEIKNNLTDHYKQAEEYMEQFSYKSEVEKILKDNDSEYMPLVTAANLTIFGAMCAILLSTKGEELTAVTLIVLICALFSLALIPLNIWFISRLKTRQNKFNTAQEKIYDHTKEQIAETLDLLFTVASNLKETYTIEALVDKSSFIFSALNELGIRKTVANHKKYLNSELEESFPATKLFFDRLSTKVRYFGLAINVLIIFVALLITTLVN